MGVMPTPPKFGDSFTSGDLKPLGVLLKVNA